MFTIIKVEKKKETHSLKLAIWSGTFSKGGPIFSADHFPTGRNCSRNSLVMALSCCSPPRSAIIVQEESSKETRFSRKCAIYFPTYDKSDEMEDVQNELRRKYEIVFKPAVLWPNINFSLRTFTAFVGVLAKKKFANLHERNRTQMHS